MTMYTHALEQLQRCIDFFYEQKNDIVKLSNRISTLENLVMGIEAVSSLQNEIKKLYDLYDGNAAVDTSTLLGLIDANTKRLDNILNGGKDLKLQYDVDVIQPGVGIGIQKSLNKVVISSEQKYSINTVFDGNFDNETEISSNHPVSTASPSKYCSMNLKPGENFAVIYMLDEGKSETSLYINIDDSEYNWEVGQSMKIYFVCENGGAFEFEDPITTGVEIRPKDNVVLSIPGAEFEGNDFVEVVCIAENKFIYLIK